MIQNKSKIILVFLSFMLAINGVRLPVKAATPAENACESQKPNYTALMKIWSDAKDKNSKAYNTAFEEAQLSYHTYVGCLFDYAEEEVLQRNNKAIDWLAPKKACVDPDKAKAIIYQTAPNAMLAPVLQAHSDYKKHLNRLGNEYSKAGTETEADGKTLRGTEQLLAKAAFFGRVKRQRQMEIDTSLVAIDMMFTSLKELRLAFVMHVHFQCTLKYLEKYRIALGELRKLIVPLPDQLRDASIQ